MPYWRRCRHFRRLPGKEINEMAVPKANQRAVNKYVKANYDRINVTMPKGEKEVIQECAAAHGESVNSFIVRSIRERIERDGAGGPQEATGQPARGRGSFTFRDVGGRSRGGSGRRRNGSSVYRAGGGDAGKAGQRRLMHRNGIQRKRNSAFYAVYFFA